MLDCEITFQMCLSIYRSVWLSYSKESCYPHGSTWLWWVSRSYEVINQNGCSFCKTVTPKPGESKSSVASKISEPSKEAMRRIPNSHGIRAPTCEFFYHQNLSTWKSFRDWNKTTWPAHIQFWYARAYIYIYYFMHSYQNLSCSKDM